MFIKRKKLKLAIIVSILLILCTVIGILKYREYTYYATRRIYTSVPVEKDSISVDCYGKGEPTVIFESGFGRSKFDWIDVQPEISKIARTLSYDRLGDGRRTTLDQVHELHTLLSDTKVKGPYIIIAHSMAGLNARLFAGTYPNEVAGIVFVDSSNENQFANPKFQGGSSKELIDILNTDANQVKEITKKDALRNIPIVVLTADHAGEEDFRDLITDWTNYQNDIASLSNKSKHISVNNSSHFIQNDHPEVVINSIKELIKQAKK